MKKHKWIDINVNDSVLNLPNGAVLAVVDDNSIMTTIFLPNVNYEPKTTYWGEIKKSRDVIK